MLVLGSRFDRKTTRFLGYAGQLSASPIHAGALHRWAMQTRGMGLKTIRPSMGQDTLCVWSAIDGRG